MTFFEGIFTVQVVLSKDSNPRASDITASHFLCNFEVFQLENTFSHWLVESETEQKYLQGRNDGFVIRESRINFLIPRTRYS